MICLVAAAVLANQQTLIKSEDVPPLDVSLFASKTKEIDDCTRSAMEDTSDCNSRASLAKLVVQLMNCQLRAQGITPVRCSSDGSGLHEDCNLSDPSLRVLFVQYETHIDQLCRRFQKSYIRDRNRAIIANIAAASTSMTSRVAQAASDALEVADHAHNALAAQADARKRASVTFKSLKNLSFYTSAVHEALTANLTTVHGETAVAAAAMTEFSEAQTTMVKSQHELAAFLDELTKQEIAAEEALAAVPAASIAMEIVSALTKNISAALTSAATAMKSQEALGDALHNARITTTTEFAKLTARTREADAALSQMRPLAALSAVVPALARTIALAVGLNRVPGRRMVVGGSILTGVAPVVAEIVFQTTGDAALRLGNVTVGIKSAVFQIAGRTALRWALRFGSVAAQRAAGDACKFVEMTLGVVLLIMAIRRRKLDLERNDESDAQYQHAAIKESSTSVDQRVTQGGSSALLEMRHINAALSARQATLSCYRIARAMLASVDRTPMQQEGQPRTAWETMEMAPADTADLHFDISANGRPREQKVECGFILHPSPDTLCFESVSQLDNRERWEMATARASCLLSSLKGRSLAISSRRSRTRTPSA